MMWLVLTAWSNNDTFARDANDTVEHLQNSLIELMQSAEEMTYEQRFQKIAPIVDETLDISAISKLVLGRHWREFSDDQKSAFLDKFRELSISTYAARFSTYNDEKFKILGQESSTRGRVIVQSGLQLKDKPPIGFEYHLGESDDSWRIINIVVDGVSDLALKRAEYNNILNDGDFDDLLSELERQITNNAEQ